MINLITGAAGSGKSTKVCEMIKNEIEHGSREVVLIVPEQQTVVWETRMSSTLPVSSNLRLEITNFTRLSNSVFRVYGGLSDAVVDEGSRALTVWRAMLSVRDSLTTFKPTDNGREDRAIPFLMSAVDELKQSGVSPAEAERALAELEKMNSSDGEGGENGENKGKYSSLISRLSDAVHVYAAYNAILHENFIDRGDLLSNLADTLSAHPYFRGKAVFVDSFFSLTAAEEKILGIIMRQAEETTVTFSCPADDRAELVHFGETRAYLKKVKSYAVREGLETRVIPLTENHRHSCSPELSEVEKRLFSKEEYSADETDEAEWKKHPTDDVKIIKCADRYDEAEACASVILKLLNEGRRYSDIAVVAHDISGYEGIIDTVLRRHGIKCFMSESSDVSSSPAVRLVLSALSVAAGGWQRKDIISLIKTGMTPASDIDPEDKLGLFDINLFEKYTYTWNIRGRRMYCADGWTMNPDGYREEISDAGREILDAVNRCKDRIIPPLDRFLSVFGDGRGLASVREICEKIVDFAEDYGVAHTLAEMSESYIKTGMKREAQRTLKSWDYVCEILDKMVAVIGDCPLNVARFSHLFAYLASKMDKGTIPTGVDEIVLGSASGVRFDEVKCVILLGAVEDEFPASVNDSGGFFDDSDKLVLENVGVELSSPDTETQAAREYFMFYRTAMAAGEKLFILAPTGEGKKLSDGADEIGKILSSCNKNATRVYGAMPLYEILFDRETALYLLSRRTDEKELSLLRSFVGEKEKQEISLTADEDRLPAAKNGRERIMLSQSAIDKFVQCPFMYCCEKKIKIKPEKTAQIRLNDVGNFIHRVLERFFGEMPAERIASGELTREEMCDYADGIIGEYVDSLAEAGGKKRGEYDGRLKYLFMRLSRYVVVFIEAMVNELSQSKFVPTAFELPIGMPSDEKGSVPPLTFETDDGCTVALRGKADRVDVYDAPDGKRYIRIVDYKTGQKEFSLDKISRGIDVQLLIYLFSLWKFGLPDSDARETVPAGAVYFSTRPKVGNVASITAGDENREKMVESVTRSGVLLDDENILRAMEEKLEGRFIPVKEKDGAIVSDDKHLFLETAEDFGELYALLGDTLGKIANEMREGAAEAKPDRTVTSNDPCGYCDYAYICKKAGK